MCSDAPTPPSQVTYGEGMADALKAQANFLKGTGEFKEVGSLESLLPLEERIRKKTAQTDTDILRQTLLGGETQTRVVRDPKTGRFGIPDGEVVMSSEGQSAGRYQAIQSTGGKLEILDTTTGGVIPQTQYYEKLGYLEPTGGQLAWDRKNDGQGKEMMTGYKLTQKGVDAGVTLQQAGRFGSPRQPHLSKAGEVGIAPVREGGQEASLAIMRGDRPSQQEEFAGMFKTLSEATTSEIQQTFNWKDPNTGEDFKPTQEGQTITTRDETGMVDIVGDKRILKEYETKTATADDVAKGLATEVGDSFVTETDSTRKAGFDAYGNFKGLSVLSEDIQRGSLSRQREADLQDVSRLSGLYGDIMEDYKPGTSSAMSGAKDLIEAQKDNLLRDVGISDPEQIASQGVQADPLRQGLMTQAEEALGQGLTDREERQIAESARARSTMMGRTLDQSGAIAEAEARVLEDNQRRMQNRGFAQSVLGQEAGIQTADDQRRMGGEQFNVGTKMDAERLRESLRMQGLLGYLDAASRISQIENQDQLDPFQAILGRGGGTALQQGQSVFGQAGYGLDSQPQYLRPESGLGFIQNQATNAANMYGAQASAKGMQNAAWISAGGDILSSFMPGGKKPPTSCWVAREVYGLHNPAWVAFRYWMLNDSPSWFRTIYIKFGERFAKFISNKPRLKARIRAWMDTKIGR
jgi:hypothetical protein